MSSFQSKKSLVASSPRHFCEMLRCKRRRYLSCRNVSPESVFFFVVRWHLIHDISQNNRRDHLIASHVFSSSKSFDQYSSVVKKILASVPRNSRNLIYFCYLLSCHFFLVALFTQNIKLFLTENLAVKWDHQAFLRCQRGKILKKSFCLKRFVVHSSWVCQWS